jgi:hypothetical protein
MKKNIQFLFGNKGINKKNQTIHRGLVKLITAKLSITITQFIVYHVYQFFQLQIKKRISNIYEEYGTSEKAIFVLYLI